jgi:uncharacterized membrane protein YsdA (DUF1294 family)
LCSISYIISTLGFLLATVMGFVLTHYFAHALTHNLWRVPYGISLLIVVSLMIGGSGLLIANKFVLNKL